MKYSHSDALLKKRMLVKGNKTMKSFPAFDMLTGAGMGIQDGKTKSKKKAKAKTKKGKKRVSKRTVKTQKSKKKKLPAGLDMMY